MNPAAPDAAPACAPSDKDAFTAFLSTLTTGNDGAQFRMLLQRLADSAKALPPGHCWVSPDASIPAPGHTEGCGVDTEADGVEREAEGVDLSHRGLPPDDSATPLPASIPLTDVEAQRRRVVWLWFAGLSLEERDRVLTVTDKQWCGYVVKLLEQVRRKGDGVFLIDTPDEMTSALDAALAVPLGAPSAARPRRSSYSGYGPFVRARVSPCASM